MTPGIPGRNVQTPYNQRGSAFASQLVSKLPFGLQIIDNITGLNPKYQEFNELSKGRESRIRDMSVLTGSAASGPWGSMGDVSTDNRFHQFMYASMDMDKVRRVQEYRTMAMYSTVSDCLDEITDELLFEKDETYVQLKISEQTDKIILDDVNKEWDQFISMFEFKDKGWKRFRQFLVDGELYFENVISQNRPDLGILGIQEIPTELISPIYSNIQNDMIENFMVRRPVLDPETGRIDREDILALSRGQVTYINSGIGNEDGTITLPFIEKARRAYKQLSMMEDCIMIYRMARAPEKLVFNVDCGQMNTPNSESHIRRLINQFWQKKTFDSSTGRVTNVYNPMSTSDSFWFAKRTGTDGTKVETLQSSANFSQMDDLLYFQKALYRAMTVPQGRLNPEDTFRDGAEMTREEIRFGKYCTRIQKQFAKGLKSSFITHLKLRGKWKEYKLTEGLIEINFNVSSTFTKLREQQYLDLKLKNFTEFTNNEGISNSYAQKAFLGWTDEQIEANRASKRLDAALAYELAMIQQNGPEWEKALQAEAEAAADGQQMDLGMFGGGGGGMGMDMSPEEAQAVGEVGMPPPDGPMSAPALMGGGSPSQGGDTGTSPDIE